MGATQTDMGHTDCQHNHKTQSEHQISQKFNIHFLSLWPILLFFLIFKNKICNWYQYKLRWKIRAALEKYSQLTQKLKTKGIENRIEKKGWHLLSFSSVMSLAQPVEMTERQHRIMEASGLSHKVPSLRNHFDLFCSWPLPAVLRQKKKSILVPFLKTFFLAHRVFKCFGFFLKLKH